MDEHAFEWKAGNVTRKIRSITKHLSNILNGHGKTMYEPDLYTGDKRVIAIPAGHGILMSIHFSGYIFIVV